MIGALLTLVVYVVILAVLWWLANYILDNFPLPEPANKIVRVALVIIIVIAAIYVLLDALGLVTGGVPRLRFGNAVVVGLA